MDIFDVSPPGALVPQVVPAGRRSDVSDTVGALLWLFTAAGLLLSCWLPVTSELKHFPAQYGVPFGFIRTNADAWGRRQSTHSVFEGPELGGGAPRYGIFLALCAVGFVVAALGARWPRIVPGSRTIGGISLVLTGGALLSIRVENLPREPIEANPGVTWQFGWGLWLATFAVVIGTFAWTRAYVRARPVIASTARMLAPSRWRALEAVLGSALSAALLVAAGFAHAYDVTVASVVNGRITHVRYSFDGWGRGGAPRSTQAALDEPIAHYAVFAARDVIPVSFAGAVLLIAALFAVRSRIHACDAVRVGAGALVGGVSATQLTVGMWMRSSYASSGEGHFGLGPSIWFLLAAVAVTGTPWAWRAWDRRIPRPDPRANSAGLDLLS